MSVQIIAYVNAYDQIGANVRQITIALSNTKNRVFFNMYPPESVFQGHIITDDKVQLALVQ